MKKFFGTDGVRGTANQDPMTPDRMMRLAIAAGRYFRRHYAHARVVIGKDTRLSGYMIEPAMTSGFTAVGMDVMLVGPLPTPAISMLTRSLRADLGVMISASHNPYYDNGVKLFDSEGYKLSDDIEREIERLMEEDQSTMLAPAQDLGRAKRFEDASGRYMEFVKNTFPKQFRLEGLRIVIDCAHGAAYKVAPTVLWELGAEVIPIGVSPDGLNINKNVGATYPQTLKEAVLEHKADLGIALDGDADRIVMVDEKGMVIDGDQLLALIATFWAQTEQLRGDTIVGTVMANLGLERYLESINLKLARTPVGDRYVSEYMRNHNLNLGGEQSGHIILSDYARTGDGLVAALQTLAVIKYVQKPVSELGRRFDPVPQILKNIKLDPQKSFDANHLDKIIKEAQDCLGKEGQLVVRKSGTEPLLRIMGQGTNEGQLAQIIDQIIDALSGDQVLAA